LKIGENIKIAFESIWSNKMRSGITIAIIALGITALVSILTATDALVFSLNSNFSSMGAKTFIINNRESGLRRHGEKRKTYPAIPYKQAAAFKKNFKTFGDCSLSFMAINGAKGKWEEKQTSPNLTISGVDDTFFNMEGMEFSAGRGFSAKEAFQTRRIIVIGNSVATKLFKQASLAINKSVKIGAHNFVVIGVLKDKGQSGSFNVNNQCFIPLSLARQIYATSFGQLNIKAKPGANFSTLQAMEEAEIIFRKIRKLQPGVKNNFVLEKSDQMLQTLTNMLGDIGSYVSIIGFITLLGSAIALMNIMLVSVTERTKEIGVRKSVGASKKMIMGQFLTEATLISLIGGFFGMLMGISLGNVVALFLDISFYVPWIWIFSAFGLCILVGILSGAYPANKASKLDPIDALRHS